MSKKRRQLKTAIFIACEGRNTEPLYFEKLVEEIGDQGRFAVTVYPDKTDTDPVTHALGLVEEARSRIDEFDEVWAVFDRNGYTKHPETFELANQPVNGKIVHIAFSSIAFEQWILLHFLKTNERFEKSAGIIARLKSEGYFPEYEKTAYIDTYSHLRDKTPLAIENAAWLRHQIAMDKDQMDLPIFQLNPYTDVDHLVGRLLGIEESVFWGRLGHTAKVGEVDILIELASDRAVSITITNRAIASIVYNAVNITTHFRFRFEGNDSQYSIDQTASIQPGLQGSFVLTVDRPCDNHLLECKNGSERLLVYL